MKNISGLAAAVLAMATLALVGCAGKGYDIAPVSGKVTSNGEPVSNLRVIFNPRPKADNSDPGPWSTGVTNAQGEFTLETRYQETGASVGDHLISFEYEQGGAEQLDQLEEDLDDAMEDGTKEEIAAFKKQIADLEKQAKIRPQISEEFTLEFTVPAGGTTEADFDFE